MRVRALVVVLAILGAPVPAGASAPGPARATSADPVAGLAPEVWPVTTTTFEGVPRTLQLSTLVSAEPRPTSFSIVTPPTHGSLDDCVDGDCTYSPEPGYTGEDEFFWTATNAVGESAAPARLKVLVIPDQPPTLYDDVVTAVANRPLTILPSYADHSPTSGTIVITTAPEHGSVVCAVRCTYTPDPGFVGTDGYSWRLDEESGHSAEAEVQIRVTQPVARFLSDRALVVPSGYSGPVSSPVESQDAAATLEVVDQPDHGRVDGCTAIGCVYTADSGFLGSDRFTWRTLVAGASSRTATVWLSVRRNAPPVPGGLSVGGGGPHVETGALGGDVDGDEVTYQLLAPPHHGRASCPGGSVGCVWDADPGFVGSDTFTYRLSDGQSWSRPGRVSLIIEGPQPPTAQDAQVRALTGRATRWPLPVDYHQAAGVVPLTIDTAPLHGTIVGCSARFCEYLPDPGYLGGDVFTFHATSDLGSTPPRPVTVTVVANVAPVATSQSYDVVMDRVARLPLVVSDASLNRWLDYRVVDGPAHGTIIACARTCFYRPDPGYTGTDSFTWVAGDGEVDSAVASADITVGLNQAPTLSESQFTAASELATSIPQFATSDPEGDWVHVRLVAPPQHGSLVGCETRSCTYISAPGYTGPDSMTWLADDGDATSDPVTTQITVEPRPVPVATGERVAVLGEAGSPVGIRLNVAETSVDRTQIRVVSPPTHGLITRCTGLECGYLPDPGFTGVDSFTWSAVADDQSSETVTETIDVQPNHALAVSVAARHRHLWVDRSS